MCQRDDLVSCVNNNNVVDSNVVMYDENLPKIAVLEIQMVNDMGDMVNNEHILPVTTRPTDKYIRQESLSSVTKKRNDDDLVSWRLVHAKLGHIRKSSIKAMSRHGTLLGLEYDMINWDDTQSCDVCARANIKQHRLPRHSDLAELQPFQKGFVDLYGPINPASVGGNKYAMMYCDSTSSFGLIKLIDDKTLSNIKSSFKYWILSANKMGFKIEMINADSDSIFENVNLVEYLNDHEIMIRYAPPGQHGKNGVIERMIQTVTSMSRAMLIAAGLPKRYWSYSITYALLIYNAITKTKFKSDENNKYLSPYTIVAKHTPVFNFPIFGCELVARNPRALQLPKLQQRGRRGAFLGFDGEHDNSVVYLNIETNSILYTDDYVLFEDYYGYNHERTDYYGKDQTVSKAYHKMALNKVYPFKHGINPDGTVVQLRENVYIGHEDFIEEESDDEIVLNANEDSDEEYWHDPDTDVGPTNQFMMDYELDEQELGNDEHDGRTQGEHHDDNMSDEYLNINFLKLRVEDKASNLDRYDRAMDVLLNGYNTGFNMDDILEPILLYNITSRIVNNEVVYLPQNLNEAKNSSSWIPGFQNSTLDEVTSMFENVTFEARLYELNELPPGTKPVDQKWIFDLKRDAEGHIKRYKSRLVTRGYLQRLYQSYIDTFSPTAMKDSVRIVLALSAMYDLMNFHWDFKTAFLNGELNDDEVIFSPVYDGYELFDVYQKYLSASDGVKLRDWIKNGKNRKLFLRMRKAAYGTKQASRTWYLTLNKWMNEHGYVSVNGDPSLYIKKVGTHFTVIAIYVDDVFGTSTNPDEVGLLFKELNKSFVVNDLGRIHQCLGMVVNYTADGIILNNEVYNDNMLKQFDMINCKTVDTPGIPNQYFGPKDVATRENLDVELQAKFRSLIGSLMFEAISWRYDIEMRVCHLARFVEFPTIPIYNAAVRVLRYLKRTANYGIKFQRVQHYDGLIQPMIIASSDSNYAADKDGISISSYVLQLADKYYWDHLDVATPTKWNVISYCSKRQREVTRSSTESEYIASALCLKNILHKKYIMDELGFPQHGIPLFIDNVSVKFMANEWKVTENSKHINTRYHFLRSHAIRETISIYYVDTEENLADIGTKPLAKTQHEYLISKFMVGTPLHVDLEKRRKLLDRTKKKASNDLNVDSSLM